MRRSILLFATIIFSFYFNAQVQYGGVPSHWEDKTSDTEVTFRNTSTLDMKSINAEDKVTDLYKETQYRFGITAAVNYNIFTEGSFVELDNGDKIWRMGIHCPNAKSINFNFGEYYVPAHGKVFIYAEDRSEFIGALTSANNKEYGSLAVGVVHSDRVIIEYYEPLGVAGQAQLSISDITHGYRPIINKLDTNKDPIGESGSCNMNVNCPDGSDWQDDKRGVALYLFDGFICTGSLINNTNEDGTPYFLTAAHCNSVANNMVFYFNHESASCAGNTGPINQTLSGATLLAVGAASDYRLVELSSSVPESYQPYFNGWDRTNSPVALAVGIHHPSGDVKKISFDDDPLQKTNYLSNTVTPSGTHWRVEAWERNTTTEGGSSGSPLFDQNHRIVGQLHGGFASCVSLTSDWYGAFGNSWSGLSSFLDPLGSGATVLDGLEGGGTCDDGIQNQGETGIDCGGPCAPCPCIGGSNVTFNITFDNFPEDISWALTAGASTIATGGNYAGLPPGSVVEQVFCLVDDCYVMTVFDSFGDGLCCANGIGSWTVFDADNNVLASETGSWTSTSSGSFCVESTTCPTDLNLDGTTDGDDFAIFLGNFGLECSPTGSCPTDFNGDDTTNGGDFAIFLGNFGLDCN